MGVMIVYLAFIILIIVGLWKVFEKAGQPGWAAIVPFYNCYVLACGVAKLEILWFILFFIPIANIVAAIKVSMAVAEKFGKPGASWVGLRLLGCIFYPILGFGSATYQGAVAAPPVQDAPPAAEG